MNISISPKVTKTTTFSQEYNILSKTEPKTIFLKLEYAGQNENRGIYPKKFGVIFFQPFLLDSEYGGNNKKMK